MAVYPYLIDDLSLHGLLILNDYIVKQGLHRFYIFGNIFNMLIGRVEKKGSSFLVFFS
jgi:hypothetical protein